jgi:hypothetical protein
MRFAFTRNVYRYILLYIAYIGSTHVARRATYRSKSLYRPDLCRPQREAQFKWAGPKWIGLRVQFSCTSDNLRQQCRDLNRRDSSTRHVVICQRRGSLTEEKFMKH